jgi:hypothetical protein
LIISLLAERFRANNHLGWWLQPAIEVLRSHAEHGDSDRIGSHKLPDEICRQVKMHDGVLREISAEK